MAQIIADIRLNRPVLWLLVFWLFFSSCTYRFYPVECEKPVSGFLERKVVLDPALSETSGLLSMEGQIWTFNDSGGEPALYSIDRDLGVVLHKTIITNATNVDWEDIAVDSTFVYVADVGNNLGTRDTLQIYRIKKKEVLSGVHTLKHSGIISVSFRGSGNCTPSGFSSRDCEALVAFQDSLYLFSKDWTELSTSIYAVPKQPGHYCVDPVRSYPVNALVTGADLEAGSGEITLVGYRRWMPVVITYNYENRPAEISCGGRARIYPLRTGRQVEGVCYDQNGNLYISSERSVQKQALFKVGRRVR